MEMPTASLALKILKVSELDYSSWDRTNRLLFLPSSSTLGVYFIKVHFLWLHEDLYFM